MGGSSAFISCKLPLGAPEVFCMKSVPVCLCECIHTHKHACTRRHTYTSTNGRIWEMGHQVHEICFLKLSSDTHLTGPAARSLSGKASAPLPRTPGVRSVRPAGHSGRGPRSGVRPGVSEDAGAQAELRAHCAQGCAPATLSRGPALPTKEVVLGGRAVWALRGRGGGNSPVASSAATGGGEARCPVRRGRLPFSRQR